MSLADVEHRYMNLVKGLDRAIDEVATLAAESQRAELIAARDSASDTLRGLCKAWDLLPENTQVAARLQMIAYLASAAADTTIALRSRIAAYKKGLS